MAKQQQSIHGTCLLFLTVLLLLISVPQTAANPLPKQTSRSIRSTQWSLFLRQVQVYNGVFQRFDATGFSFNNSLFTRNFTQIADSPEGYAQVLQTNTYVEPTFSITGEVAPQYLYQDADSPKYAARILPNGTVLPPVQDDVYFYPSGYGIWPSPNIITAATPFAGVEKYILDPTDSQYRITTTALYSGGSFLYILLARESTTGVYPPSTGTRFTTKRNGTPYSKTNPYHEITGSFAVVKQCVTKAFMYKRTLTFVKGALPLLVTGSKRLAIKLPDGISLSFPREVGPKILGERALFQVQWVVSHDVIVRSWAVYTAEGAFLHDCTATYYRVTV